MQRRHLPAATAESTEAAWSPNAKGSTTTGNCPRKSAIRKHVSLNASYAPVGQLRQSAWTRRVISRLVLCMGAAMMLLFMAVVALLAWNGPVPSPNVTGVGTRKTRDDHTGWSFFSVRRRHQRKQLFPNPLTELERQLPEDVLDLRRIRHGNTRQSTASSSEDLKAWSSSPRAASTETTRRRNQTLNIIVVPFSLCPTTGLYAWDADFSLRVVGIVSTMIQALGRDARRRFVWFEVAYFAWWWDQQDHATQQMVKTRLLPSKQLEFVTGAWTALVPATASSSASSSSSSSYQASESWFNMQLNLQEGHDWIRNHLGAQFVPRAALILGGSPPHMTAALLKQFNFTALVLQQPNIDLKVTKPLTWRRHYEFFWRTSTSTSTWSASSDAVSVLEDDPFNGQRVQAQNDLFTHLMPHDGYSIRQTCGPDPHICCLYDFISVLAGYGGNATCPRDRGRDGSDDVAQPEAINADNVQQQAERLLQQYRKKARLFRSNTLLIPLGDEFRFQSKREVSAQLDNYQRLFDYVNANMSDGVHIQFGILSDYIRAARTSFVGPVPFVTGSLDGLSSARTVPSSNYNDNMADPLDTRQFDVPLNLQLERSLFAAESFVTHAGTTDDDVASMRRAQQRPRRALLLRRHYAEVPVSTSTLDTQNYIDRMLQAIADVQNWMREVFNKKQSQGGVNGLLRPITNWTEAKVSLVDSDCLNDNPAIVYNPLSFEHSLQQSTVKGRAFVMVSTRNLLVGADSAPRVHVEFDKATGQMTAPVREEWIVRRVSSHNGQRAAAIRNEEATLDLHKVNHTIEQGGWVVSNSLWSRTIVVRDATTIDLIFVTNGRQPESEHWMVRLSSDHIKNKGYYYTSVDGFNFDTVHVADEALNPVQRMATMAAIQDDNARLTVLSEEPQYMSHWKDGSLDVSFAKATIPYDYPELVPNATTRPWRASSKLRIELESRPPFKAGVDFTITPYSRQMWSELHHPLEVVWQQRDCPNNLISFVEAAKAHFATLSAFAQLDQLALMAKYRTKPIQVALNNITVEVYALDDAVVPFVYMVYKRKDYLQSAIDSLRNSDFPRDRVPLIISHDGHVPDMVEFVNSLKTEFQVIQLFHPFACYDHPDTFPGNDPKLNVGYQGDAYGNPRSFEITCSKHHFTWLLTAVFANQSFIEKGIDTFLFMEEDYVVAPNVYSAILHGLNGMNQFANETIGGFLGLNLDPTWGGRQVPPVYTAPNDWFAEPFMTGPMTLHRSTFVKLQSAKGAAAYCGLDGFDEYNWDWSFVYVQHDFIIPHTVLTPASPLARHIGLEGGMHHGQSKDNDISLSSLTINNSNTLLPGSSGIRGSVVVYPRWPDQDKGNGGWGHPADHAHCMQLLRGTNDTLPATVARWRRDD